MIRLPCPTTIISDALCFALAPDRSEAVNLKCHCMPLIMWDTFALLPLDRSIGVTVHTNTRTTSILLTWFLASD
jgi:hypothetical protein